MENDRLIHFILVLVVLVGAFQCKLNDTKSSAVSHTSQSIKGEGLPGVILGNVWHDTANNNFPISKKELPADNAAPNRRKVSEDKFHPVGNPILDALHKHGVDLTKDKVKLSPEDSKKNSLSDQDGLNLKFLDNMADFRNLAAMALVAGPAWARILQVLRNVLQSVSRNCGMDLLLLSESLSKYEGWAMKMVDASAKPGSGILVGNMHLLGAFQECVDIAVDEKKRQFSGEYCLLHMNARNVSAILPLVEKVLDLGDPISEKTANTYADLRAIPVGVCVPSSCSKDDVIAAANAVFESPLLGGVPGIRNAYCVTSEGRPFRGWDWFTMWVITAALILVILSTTYELLSPSPKSATLSAFSAYGNWKIIMSTSKKAAPSQLSCIHGIRFLSMSWVILGHRYMLDALGQLQNGTEMLKDSYTWKMLLATAAPLAVDTFFVMSGLLLSYTFLNVMSHSKLGFNVPLFYLLRYLRISPAYFFIVLFHSTLFTHLGSGPMHEQMVERSEKDCSSAWLPTFLYVNKILGFKKECWSPSWFLEVDMQLYWLSPILLLAIWKRPRLARFLVTALLIIGVIVSFSVNYVNGFSPGFTTKSWESLPKRMDIEYTPFYTRYTTWLIGFIAGWIMYHAQGNKLSMSKTHLVVGWGLSTGVLLIATVGLLPFQQKDHVFHPVMDPLYVALSRPLWAAAVSWLIFACVHDYAGPLNAFLSWRFFWPLSRLSFGMFLVHWSVALYRNDSIKYPLGYSQYEEMLRVLGDLLISVLAAVPVVMIFETPVTILSKSLLTNAFHERPKEFSIVSPKKQTSSSKDDLHHV